MQKFKLVFNSPTIICFTVICLVVTILGEITAGYTDSLLFSVYKAPLSDIFTYFRFIGHVFGHADFQHFIGNIMLLLLLGPLLEEKYGSKVMIMIILITAVVTGLVQFILFNSALLGASGVVFALILLSSITGTNGKEIPVTFVLVTVLYIGSELYSAIFVNDNVSQLTHIVGGIVGACVGFYVNMKAKPKYQY